MTKPKDINYKARKELAEDLVSVMQWHKDELSKIIAAPPAFPDSPDKSTYFRMNSVKGCLASIAQTLKLMDVPEPKAAPAKPGPRPRIPVGKPVKMSATPVPKIKTRSEPESKVDVKALEQEQRQELAMKSAAAAKSKIAEMRARANEEKVNG